MLTTSFPPPQAGEGNSNGSSPPETGCCDSFVPLGRHPKKECKPFVNELLEGMWRDIPSTPDSGGFLCGLVTSTLRTGPRGNDRFPVFRGISQPP